MKSERAKNKRSNFRPRAIMNCSSFALLFSLWIVVRLSDCDDFVSAFGDENRTNSDDGDEHKSDNNNNNSNNNNSSDNINTICEPLSVSEDLRCQYVTVTPSCTETSSFIRYEKVHYCQAKGRWTYSFMIALLLMGVFFHVLATVAECFFCPALAKISVYLKMRDDVAGATLLAFGNGAPDIFAQIAALNDLSQTEETDGIPLALGAVLGAGMFIAFVVFPSVVLSAPPARQRLRSGRRVGGFVEVDKRAFMRDCGFYCLGVIALVRCIYEGEVTFKNAMQLFALYALYVVTVLMPENWRRVPQGLAERLSGLRREGRSRVGGGGITTEIRPNTNVLDGIAEENEDDEGDDDDDDAEVGLLEEVSNEDDAQNNINDTGERDEEDDVNNSRSGDEVSETPSASEISSETAFDDEDDDDDDDASILHHPWERGWRRNRLYEGNESIWNQLYHALISVATLPLFLIRETLKFTMPELGFNGRRVRRWQTSALPICAPLFFVLAEKMYPGTIHLGGLIYGIIVACAFSAIIFTAWPHLMPDNYAITLRRRSNRNNTSSRSSSYPSTTSNPASRLFTGMLTVIAFLVSMIWMDVVAGEVVSLLTAAGKICGISEALLGATVLAWGNSVGDFIANRTIARDGRPKMAVAACFAGPTMNVLLGTGTGLALRTFRSGAMSNIEPANELFVLFAFLILGLIFLLFAAPLLWHWRVGRTQSFGMIAYYVVFACVYALTSTGIIFKSAWRTA
jgi:solute carrier family 24 (sodium/potassium/calcium exchanger), member 6